MRSEGETAQLRSKRSLSHWESSDRSSSWESVLGLLLARCLSPSSSSLHLLESRREDLTCGVFVACYLVWL